MNMREKFDLLAKELSKLRGDVATFQQTSDAPELREILDELLPKFDRAVAGMKETFPQAMAEIEKDLADCERRNVQTERTLNELQRKRDEGLRPRPPAAAAAALPSGYGTLLRTEVLQRFGERLTAVPPVAQQHDSVASAWSDPGESVSADASVAPADADDRQRPAPDGKKPAKPNNDKEAWEGLTAMED